MAQHDFTIANQTASSARSDINSALQALATNNGGSSAPTTTYASMFWFDTSSNMLKMRDQSDSAWINVAYFNAVSSKFNLLDDTFVVNTSGTQTGLIGDQPLATWQAGTGTTESLVSPAKVKAAAASEIARSGVSFGTTYSTPYRAGSNTPYQNTGDTHMVIYIDATGHADILSVSADGNNWYNVYDWAGGTGPYERASATLIVPPNHYYRYSGSSYISWVELS